MIMVCYAGCGPSEPRWEETLPTAEKMGGCRRSEECPPFWWGVSTASYQCEDRGPATDGKSYATDWDLFAEAGKCDPRDDRVASFAHFERDLAALKRLGVTHYRFSVEWARVEPTFGHFDEAAIAHYVHVAERLREEGICPIVCLWHFTFPDWLCDFDHPERHGWFHPSVEEAWGRYVRLMTQRLMPHVEIFAPQNEPNAYAFCVGAGLFPPGKATTFGYFDRLITKEVDTFRQAVEIIRAERPDAKILSVQNIVHWERDPLDIFGLFYRAAIEYNQGHLDGIASLIDYLGFNYYSREIASPLAGVIQSLRSGENVSDVGWIIDARGLETEIMELSRRYHKPLVITENGIADRGDRKRQMYLYQHLLAIRRALAAGYDVRGFFHWTLMDDFEWMLGYEPKMGLYSVDLETKSLVPKPSAEIYRSLIAGKFMDVESVGIATTLP